MEATLKSLSIAIKEYLQRAAAQYSAANQVHAADVASLTKAVGAAGDDTTLDGDEVSRRMDAHRRATLAAVELKRTGEVSTLNNESGTSRGSSGTSGRFWEDSLVARVRVGFLV